MNEICVIGGSRDFGRRLAENLRDHGARVTVVNRDSSAPPEGVTHLRNGRGDEKGMRLAPPAVRVMWSADLPCSPPVPKAHGRSMVRKRPKLFIGMAAASAVVLSSGRSQAAQAAQLNSAGGRTASLESARLACVRVINDRF
ncbi:hypothetical protein ACIBKY_50755 [Nonomuraea sp. NPDC050394]|uniref:hypothetical protein n=1 Tax=Nonomuraea sp. NPDC050394 TaxID=3364363 RepID=UPI0037B193FF